MAQRSEIDRGAVLRPLMGSDMVVVASLGLNDDFCFGPGAEPFDGPAFVSAC